MPPIPKKGQIINGYRLIEHLHKGAMANCFSAVDTRNGDKLMFFKSYISPTPVLDWYRGYINYVKEIDNRLANPSVRQFCVKTTDQFEAPLSPKSATRFFFQVFEFIEGGHDLESLMDKAREHPELLPWDTRLTMAKVFVAGLKQLHAVNIVHADLKPANIQMLPDPGTKIGFKPRLIDMDFSLLDDITAPWDGKVGYVGTPGYYSPEHLSKEPGANIPRLYSDIFTTGIILCELLAGKHPYTGKYDDIEEYRNAVMSGDHNFRDLGLTLLGMVSDSPEQTTILSRVILACLSPDPAKRPTVETLHQALLGRLEHFTPIDFPFKEHPADPSASPSEPKQAPQSNTLVIKGDIGSVSYRIPGTVGRSNLGSVSSDAKFASYDQFKLLLDDDQWFIAPCDEPTNYTTVNGNILDSPLPIKGEILVALKSRSSDNTAMPLTITIE